MVRERIKTALLTVLILSSVVLSLQIWTSEKLWPEGYDFFSVYPKNFISSVFSGIKPKDTVNINVTGALDSVFSPGTVMLSYSDGRVLLNDLQGQGKDALDIINSVLTETFKKNLTVAEETEWQNALKGRNIYADYSVDIGIFEMASFLGTTSPDAKNSVFDNIVISMDESSSGTVPVYIRHSKTNNYYKALVPFDITKIENVFTLLSRNKMLNLSYSYELGLNKKLTGDMEKHQKVIIGSYVLLPLDTINMTEISPKSPDTTENKAIKAISNALGFNINTSQHFTQTDETEVFIGSTASLSVSKNGYFEYIASSDDTGIKVAEKTDFAGTVAGSAEVLDKILSEFNLSEETRLFINTPLISQGEDKNTLYFDYTYDANPIYMGDDMHGCIVNTSGGRITSVKMYIKSFEKVSSGPQKNPLQIIDKLYLMQGQGDIIIEELYCGYLYNPSKMPLNWFAKTNKSDAITVVE